MDKQLIINVGRQVGSGGLIIAKMLAKAFDCKFYDKEILNLAAQESGFSEKFFEKNDETKEYLRSRFHIHVPLLGESSFYSSDFSQEGLYKFQSEAIRKAAQEGRCVFVGRTADYILRDMKEKVDVFVTAASIRSYRSGGKETRTEPHGGQEVHTEQGGHARRILQLLHRKEVGRGGEL